MTDTPHGTQVDEVTQWAIVAPNGWWVRNGATIQDPRNRLTNVESEVRDYKNLSSAKVAAREWTEALRGAGGMGEFAVVTRTCTVVKPPFTRHTEPFPTETEPF